MKKIFTCVMVALMSGLLMTPQVEAQGRRGGNHGNTSVSAQRPGRGGGNSRPGQGNTRPGGNGGGNHNAPTRPSNPGNRPGGGSHVKPVAPRPPQHGNRPVRPGDHGYRPAPPPAGPVYRPVRPGMSHRPPTMAPPPRPMRPIYGAWTRPVPPPGWRPSYNRPLMADVLGLTFGIAIGTALDNLYSNGYDVDGYGQREVYLRSVRELGYVWDDATLYFNTGGALARSQFFDSTRRYDMSRYYNVYSTLCSRYGVPVSSSSNGNEVSATWFGYSGDYVSLQYTMMNTSSGFRYFTVLTYGN